MKIRTLLLSGMIAALPLTACKDKPSERAEEAAEEVADKRADLREEIDDVAKSRGDDLDDRQEELEEATHASANLAQAGAEFAQRRDEVVRAMRVRHAVFDSQTHLARDLLAAPGRSVQAATNATDRVLTLEREVGESELAIDALATATADQWDTAYTTAADAMKQLEGAFEDAFDALNTGTGEDSDSASDD